MGSRIQGESPLVPVAGVIGLEVEYPAFLARYFRNGAHLGGVLHTEMGAQQLKDMGRAIVTEFADQFRGANQHRLAALGKGSTYEAFEVNLQGLTDQGISQFIDSRILNAMRVPRVLVETLLSTGSGLNSDVYRTQARAWWNGSVRSMLKLIAGGLTMGFRDELGNLRFDFDLSDVGPLQIEKAEAARWVLPVYEAGLMRMDTAQEEMGLPIDTSIQPPDVSEGLPTSLEGLPVTTAKRMTPSAWSAYWKACGMATRHATIEANDDGVAFGDYAVLWGVVDGHRTYFDKETDFGPADSATGAIWAWQRRHFTVRCTWDMSLSGVSDDVGLWVTGPVL